MNPVISGSENPRGESATVELDASAQLQMTNYDV